MNACSFTRHLGFQRGRRTLGRSRQPKLKTPTSHRLSSSDGGRGGGAYRVNWNGDEVPLGKGYKNIRLDEVSKRVWEHTMKVFETSRLVATFVDDSDNCQAGYLFGWQWLAQNVKCQLSVS